MKTKSMHTLKLLIVMSLYTLTGCSQDQDPVTTPTVATIYDGCCGTEPKIYEIEDYKVYIPNIITPNNDGINDAFYPICNKMEYGKFTVSDYRIYDDTGNIIFVLGALDIENPEEWGFKGKGYKRPFIPREHENFEYIGKFKYSFKLILTKNDSTYEFIDVEGDACVIRCDEDAHVFKNKAGCYFPIQGQNGIFNPLISRQEENCIK